ncbi:Hira [Drosophila busckii]|uniref:Protein HIRA n=1 Tax=Drosophila busckii TaxID=30019 RepID=A0A0M5JAB2_DROBS|nr:protein HIRA homolog [Drosophila busckii]ALC48348.1 Hira [Drosophila busckii]
MRLVKPGWVHHDDKPIFSVDVHQDCTKFATGGQGVDSGRVVIWNLKPVLSEKAENDASEPKMLCQMDQHLACVNCVRWSQNGQMLASGSDDKLIMIWRKSLGASGVFGTGGMQQNHESWKCIHTLRGHDGDVLDLAWSPNDVYLASCSIDNTIIIWDARHLPGMVQKLKGHTGLVKGVAWDPVGKFLASQSDDRSIKIWRTCDWSCSTTITEPFQECGGTTHILRLSWSPDGQYLVSAHAMNGGGPTAQIVEREGWKCDKDFVGHRKAVTCVRFHNSILKRQSPNADSPSKPRQYCVLGVGSRDRSLSVWVTALQRPMIVIHELFNDSVLDMSWGPQQCLLMACSGDGTIACLQFNEEELGTRVSEQEKKSIFVRKYGGCVEEHLVYKPQQQAVPELTSYALPNAAMERRLPVQPSPTGSGSGSPGLGSPQRAIAKQTETRTKDGKRRITPMFIPLNDVDENSDKLESSINSNRNFVASSFTTSKNNKLDTASEPMSRLTQSSGMMERSGGSSTIATLNSSHCGVASVTGGAGTLATKLQITANSKSEFTKSAQDYRIHVQNGHLKTGYGMVSKVTAMMSRELLWDMYVGSPLINVTLCSKFVMLCSLDGSMRLLAMQTGCPVFPAMTLASPALNCAFSSDFQMVGVITDSGQLRVWNIAKRCVCVSTGCLELLTKHGVPSQFVITDQGMPLLGFGKAASYSYCEDLKSWLLLGSSDAIMLNGIRGSLPRDLEHMQKKFPLLSMQASSHNYLSLRGPVEIDPESWQQTAKVLFLENQIKLCESLQAYEELKHWHVMLTFQLATYATEKRLRVFLDNLISNVERVEEQLSEAATPIRAAAQQCAVAKHELMQCVLDSLKPHIQWEHIYDEYMESYKRFSDHYSTEQPVAASSAITYPMPTAPCPRTRAAAAAEAAIEALLTAEVSSPSPAAKLDKDDDSEDTTSSSPAASAATPESTTLEADKN